MTDTVDARFEELKRLNRLPSPNGVALEVMRLTQRDEVTVGEIANALLPDPALTGRLVHLANSAVHAGRRPVLAIHEVVSRLGLSLVRQTVLGFSLVGEHREGHCAGFDFDAFWSHSLATAIAAQSLARHLKAAAPDECFVLGLLGNIGALALASVYPERYAKLIERAGGAEAPELLDLERADFAMDHAEVTAAMLGDWGFPKVFCNAALHFGNPQRFQPTEGSRTASLAALLGLAATVASMCVLDDAGRSRMLAQLYRRGANVAIDTNELAAMLPEIVETWRQWGSLLSIPTRDVPSLEEIEQARQDVPPMTAGGGAGATVPLRCLVVDDDRSSRELIASWLRTAGHQVRMAANGDEAMQEVIKDPPQVLVSDWEMPVMDGLRLCKALRESSPGRQIDLILVTGHGNEDRLAEAFAAGADDYITKPLRARELEARLCAGRRFIEVHQTSIRDSTELRAIANELVIANRRLKYLARTDELTGLPNRRYTMERLEQEIAAAARRRQPFGLLVGDIDLFKQINDTYGHQQGDAALKAVSRALRAAARAEDTVGRVGGEEFMVIAPAIDQDGLLALAERLRSAVAAIRPAGERREAGITISFGATLRQTTDTTSRELIRRCDQALYRAKQQGRNRVVFGD